MKTNNDGSYDHDGYDRDDKDDRDDHEDNDATDSNDYDGKNDSADIKNINDDNKYNCTHARLHIRARPCTLTHWLACTPAHTH